MMNKVFIPEDFDPWLGEDFDAVKISMAKYCNEKRDYWDKKLRHDLEDLRKVCQNIISGNAPLDLPMLQEAQYTWACEMLKSAIK